MITALNPATIGGELPLREYVTLAEKYGFGGIEFSIERATQLAKESSLEHVRTIFEQYGVGPAVFGLPVEWRKGDSEFEDNVQNLAQYAEFAASIGCSRTSTWIPPAINGDATEFSALIAKRFQSIARILDNYQISLALEFVGPDTCRIGPTAHGSVPFIHTIAQTITLIEQIDAKGKNVGLLLDSFHWYTSAGTTDDILALTSDQVVHVHINDAPDVPRTKQMDFERLLPGEGVIDLHGFLKTLARIGYGGYVAVETFNRDLSAKGPERAAQLTEEAVERLLLSL